MFIGHWSLVIGHCPLLSLTGHSPLDAWLFACYVWTMKLEDTPIYIPVRDRLGCLRELVEWLEAAGAQRIVLVDMDSTYPPLLEYFAHTPHRVEHPGNIGARGLWHRGLLAHDLVDAEQRFVVSDPDVIPDASCPCDLLAHLHELMDQFPSFAKIGLALRIDDLPVDDPALRKVVDWEKRWWSQPVGDFLFDCGFGGVATTFALYRGLAYTDNDGDGPSARTNLPYVARHVSWYLDAANLPEDEKWYYDHAPQRRWRQKEPGVTWRPGQDAYAPAVDDLQSEPPQGHLHSPLRNREGRNFYGGERLDVLSMVANLSISAKTVLEFGCSGGRFSRRLKAHLQADRYIGVERNPVAAREARSVLDDVIEDDIDELIKRPDFMAENSLDLVVALDVLEHLYDPWNVVWRSTQWLKPGGQMLLTMPNVQNIHVLTQLVEGRWAYEPTGLLDATHIRFFTLQGLIEMLTGAGLEIANTTVTLNPPVNADDFRPERNMLRFGKCVIHNLSKDEALRFYAYQYLVLARKP